MGFCFHRVKNRVVTRQATIALDLSTSKQVKGLLLPSYVFWIESGNGVMISDYLDFSTPKKKKKKGITEKGSFAMTRQ